MGSQNTFGIIVALDVGAVRVGVATANTVARLASPDCTLDGGAGLMDEIARFCKERQAVALVVGLPRSLDGNDTAQTSYVRGLVSKLTATLDLPVYLQDEAVTSKLAEAELKKRRKPYNKGDIDAMAAAIILQDFLDNPPKEAKEF